MPSARIRSALLALGCAAALVAVEPSPYVGDEGGPTPRGPLLAAPGGASGPDPVEPAPEVEPQPGEVLWRQIVLENGRTVLIRDSLTLGPDDVPVRLRDAFVMSGDQVVDRIPLDPEGKPIEQISLTLRAQPITGLLPAESPRVFEAMAFLSRPAPRPEILPPSLAAEAPGGELYWHQVVIADGRIMVFWDRLTEGGTTVRDGFLIDRAEVIQHQFLDPASDAVSQAARYALDDTVVGPLEPAAEPNVLVVAHYLDDFAGQGGGVTQNSFALKGFARSQPNTVPETDPGTDPPNVSPSGGAGGF